jgi:hypothetical protein
MGDRAGGAPLVGNQRGRERVGACEPGSEAGALYFPVFNNERGTYPEAYGLPLARTGKRPNDLPCRGRGALKAASALSTGRGRNELRRIGRISAVFMRIAFEGQNRGGERR